MPILDAALAFALTMLVVATVVTQLLNAARKLTKIRQKRMREMIEDFFGKELRPVVDRELLRLSDRIDEAGRKALEELPGGNEIIAAFPESEELVHVSTQELLERLKRSDLGSKLLTHLNDEAQGVFDELGRRWELVGERFTESYRMHSRRWTMAVAGLLALAVNIDSLQVLDSYLTNRHLTDAVTAQLSVIVEAADNAELAAADASDPVADLTALRDEMERLSQAGFPIGADHFPHACLVGSDAGRADCEARMSLWGWTTWILGVLLTALLAGLGAPFWYDAVAGISKAAKGRGRG